jgi:hypothetical protein
MASVRSKGLDDVVGAAVPLQDPDYRRVADDKTVHPDGAILVDLVVRREDVRRVLRRYGVIDFVPMSNEDPALLSQPGDKIEGKQTAYGDMLERYSRYLREITLDTQSLAAIPDIRWFYVIVEVEVHSIGQLCMGIRQRTILIGWSSSQGWQPGVCTAAVRKPKGMACH